MDEQIVDFLAKGIVEKVVHTEPEFFSNVLVRPKKERVIGLMRQNCCMASLDLSNTYFSIPIEEPNRCFLKFQWKDDLYQFMVMLNGLTSAPRIFTKIFKPVYASLRKMGFIVCGYIDD